MLRRIGRGVVGLRMRMLRGVIMLLVVRGRWVVFIHFIHDENKIQKMSKALMSLTTAINSSLFLNKKQLLFRARLVGTVYPYRLRWDLH